MAYRIDPEKAPAGELRRIAQEQITKALKDLENEQLREAVHEARKRLKKLRALLRLYRPLIGDLYDQENVRFRDIARGLASVRDATTLVEALDALENHSDDAFDAVRSGLQDRREQVELDAEQDALIPQARRALETALAEITKWRCRDDAADGFPTGVKLTYKRGRDALAEARRSPNMERLHELRKRAKYHRYHCRLLGAVWKQPLRAREREAHDLTDLLGEHHDLSVLEQAVHADRPAFGGDESVERLLSHSARHRAELEDRTFRLGARLYAEKPKEAFKRLERYWRVAQR